MAFQPIPSSFAELALLLLEVFRGHSSIFWTISRWCNGGTTREMGRRMPTILLCQAQPGKQAGGVEFPLERRVGPGPVGFRQGQQDAFALFARNRFLVARLVPGWRGPKVHEEH